MANSSLNNMKKPSWLSRLFFWWELPILNKGWKQGLTDEDLLPVYSEHKCKLLGDKMEKAWFEESKKGKNSSLMRAIMSVFRFECWLYGTILFPIDLILSLLQPYLLKKLLDYHTPNQTEVTQLQAYLYSFSIVMLSFIYILIFHSAILELYNLGMKLRIACTSLLFKKCLSMKKHTLQQFTIGRIINLMSNDVYRLDLIFSHFHYMWMSPIKLLASTYYLHVTFGSTSTLGVVAIILALLAQVYISKKAAAVRNSVALKTDYRIRLMSDIVNGIQLIKMYTWEIPFSKLIHSARCTEIEEITLANHFRICSSIIKIYVPKISVLFCILAASFKKLSITSQYVFSLTNLYENLKFTAIVRMPVAFFRYAEAQISVQRIQDFLLLDDNVIDRNTFKSTGEVSGVFLQNVSVKWENKSPFNTLNGVTFSAKPGELVCVIGPAGSGKSTLLQVILSEMDVLEGTVNVGGRVSYSSQEPWIFSGTIRENILFGLDLDEVKYSKILKMVALDHDLLQFPYGDSSAVGEKGVMLSGGQKARISLARAVYREADIYLLDDPLSAVDVQVARQIFDDCIRHYLRNKCVVLVTHQVQLLHNADNVYLLESGMIRKVITHQEMETINSCQYNNNRDENIVDTRISEKLRHEIIMEKRAATSDYVNYIKSGGSCVMIISLFLLLVFNQSLGYLIDYFITFWVNTSQMSKYVNDNFFMTTQTLYIYGFLVLFLTFITHTGAWLFVKFCKTISNNFHNTMFSKVLQSPIKFFQSNSSGAIMHRFSKDLGHIDEFIPASFNEVLTQILMVLGLTIVICLLNSRMIIPSLILYIVFYYCAVIFQPSNISIRRIEANARSPIFSYLSSTMQGLTTVKALSAPKVLQEEFNRRQDFHTSSFHLFRSLFFSLGFWTDVILLFYTGAVAFSFFFVQETNVGDVGLAVTLSTILGGMIQLGMKSWGELDSYVSSVERIVEYSDLPQEQDNGVSVPTRDWPQKGHILFRDVSLRYSPDAPFVLKRASFEIQDCEKIGIVGRTGAGKTSLTSALFRLFDFEGTILVDGVDTKTLPLNFLRSKMSIIPQEPVLFLGSLRKNLDPFEEFTDFQLWQALEDVQLKELFVSKPLGLYTEVSEGGLNFSVGQRQLLCLARTILRDARIIVFDEATANVDTQTDNIIQNTIRKRFQKCTVLTIAHRLNTVMDSDKILVMEDGNVVEFGSPHNLLINSVGYFYRFVNNK